MPDPRTVRSRQRVLCAAVELLREDGTAGLTVEAVAARSGVAKTTIYRQFADRDEIHVAAIEAATVPLEMTVTDDVVADVRRGLRLLAAKLRDDELPELLATVVEAAERSDRMALLAKATCDARRRWMLDRLRLGLDSGELAGGDAELLASLLAGPLFFRRLISREPIDDEFVDAVVARVLAPLATAARA